MDWGTVVWLPDRSLPFLVQEDYCSNPECTCNVVSLTLLEIGDGGIEVSSENSLCLRVDLETWKEPAPPERSLQSAILVRQFLSEFPAHRRAEIKERHVEAKQFARRIAQYTMNPADVNDGILFPYADLMSDRKSLTSRGQDYTYTLVYQDNEYLIEDLYCPNPGCDCREFNLQFWIRKTEVRNDVERVIISPLFLGTLKFTGQRSVSRLDCPQPVKPEVLLTHWWDSYSDELPMLLDRYHEVKEIARRSLQSAKVASPSPRSMPAQQAPSMRPSRFSAADLDDMTLKRKNVGRNDFCPCGSGVKFKKCCGQKS